METPLSFVDVQQSSTEERRNMATDLRILSVGRRFFFMADYFHVDISE